MKSIKKKVTSKLSKGPTASLKKGGPKATALFASPNIHRW